MNTTTRGSAANAGTRGSDDSAGSETGGPHLVLVGSMGVGKSTVGRLLAARMGRPFVDNDDLLAERTGRSADDIATAGGIGELHGLEAELLARALERPGALVLAAAASVVTSEAGRAALGKAGQVVWLRDDPAAMAARVRSSRQHHRPDLAAFGLDRVEAQRRPLFESVATLVVDVAGDPPDAVAERIVAALARRTG